MAAQALPGTTLSAGTAGSEALIGNITSVEIPGIDDSIVEGGSHDNLVRTVFAGMGSNGQISFDLEFDPADYATIIALRQASQSFVIKLPPIIVTSNNVFTFTGILTKFGPISVPHDGMPTASGTIEVDTAAVVTTAA